MVLGSMRYQVYTLIRIWNARSRVRDGKMAMWPTKESSACVATVDDSTLSKECEESVECT